MKYLLAIIALLIPTVAYAGHVRVNCGRGHRVVALQKAVVLQQVYPAHYYSAGAHLQEEALAERIAQKVLSKIAVNNKEVADKEVADKEVADKEVNAAAFSTLVGQRCAKCHSGEAPKGGLSLVDLSALTCEQKLKAIHLVVEGKMPKDRPLSPDEAGRILSELSSQPSQPLNGE